METYQSFDNDTTSTVCDIQRVFSFFFYFLLSPISLLNLVPINFTIRENNIWYLSLVNHRYHLWLFKLCYFSKYFYTVLFFHFFTMLESQKTLYTRLLSTYRNSNSTPSRPNIATSIFKKKTLQMGLWIGPASSSNKLYLSWLTKKKILLGLGLITCNGLDLMPCKFLTIGTQHKL